MKVNVPYISIHGSYAAFPQLFLEPPKNSTHLNPHLSQVTTDEFDAAFKIPEIRPCWGSCGKKRISIWVNYPIPSMYGIIPYMYHKNQPHVGEYIIHGWYGYLDIHVVKITLI